MVSRLNISSLKNVDAVLPAAVNRSIKRYRSVGVLRAEDAGRLATSVSVSGFSNQFEDKVVAGAVRGCDVGLRRDSTSFNELTFVSQRNAVFECLTQGCASLAISSVYIHAAIEQYSHHIHGPALRRQGHRCKSRAIRQVRVGTCV